MTNYLKTLLESNTTLLHHNLEFKDDKFQVDMDNDRVKLFNGNYSLDNCENFMSQLIEILENYTGDDLINKLYNCCHKYDISCL